MKNWRCASLASGVAAASILLAPLSRAQSVAQAVDAIDHARVATRILYVTAHPDDEHESVLTYLSKGLGADVALCSTTRGEGGQNAIGPELGPALEILRTEELYRATQDYGVELFFTRAPDFGFSKSAEETLHIWNGIAKEDLVRIIRTFRPHIVINQWGGVHSGHGQHQATGIIVPQAVQAAADPTQYSDQLKEGLRTWHVGWVLQYARSSDANQEGVIQLPVGDISPVWGQSYADLGLIGFGNHRSQGITRILNSSFFRRPVALKVEEGGQLTPGDLAQPLFSIGADSNLTQLTVALGAADGALTVARQAALRLDWPAAVKSLAAAGMQIQKAINETQAYPAMAGKDVPWELDREKRKIDNAIAEAVALNVNAEANRSALVAGESFSADVNWEVRDNLGVQIAPPSLELPQGWSAQQEPARAENGNSATDISFRVSVPAGATPPTSPEDAILPWHPPLVQAELTGVAYGYTFVIEKPVISHEYTSTSVEVSPLELVPAVTLTVDPQQVMLPVKRAEKSFQLLARVSYHASAPAQVSVGIDLPQGWSAAPVAPLDFSGAGVRLVRFGVTPPANAAEGAYDLKPFAQMGDQTFRTSYEALPSLPSRHVSEPAIAAAHVLDLAIPADLRVGYIAAGIDPVPQTLQQLGIQVDMLDEATLSFGDLSRYNAIVVGIRAYELRPDVLAANHRLLDYVERGGTLVVQYERDFAWNRMLPAPFPAKMDQPAERITDENSPVRFLDPSSPLLNYPNQITQSDFRGWIQERGLYYLGEHLDPRYHAILAMHDPGDADATGGLVYAQDGKGIYIYTGIAFFRQLPAGVPGAYRLFANLLSATQSPAR